MIQNDFRSLGRFYRVSITVGKVSQLLPSQMLPFQMMTFQILTSQMLTFEKLTFKKCWHFKG